MILLWSYQQGQKVLYYYPDYFLRLGKVRKSLAKVNLLSQRVFLESREG